MADVLALGFGTTVAMWALGFFCRIPGVPLGPDPDAPPPSVALSACGVVPNETLFFLLLAPVNSAGLHLKALAKISRMLMSQPFRDNLMKASGAEEIYRLIAERDAEF